ncbi:MAG: PPOX class F420-dependent oxidoreductase [Actinobacteria bacterium]|nr:MAG: PPOX class F420-dependent oxidoreductase [Actinomycetota bacterium]
MNLDEARQFLRENHRTVLSTFRADGRPQLSPVAAAVDADGRAVVSSRETAFKVKNLRRDPRASLCVVADNWYGGWVQVDGTATVVSLPEAMELLVDYYRSVAGEHPDWDDYRAAMERERRVMVRIELERAGPDRQG